MNKITTQAKSEISHIKANKAKYIGSAVGITAGITYGIGSKRNKWAIAGLAMVGAVAGAIVGGMFETKVIVAPIVVNNGTNNGAGEGVIEAKEGASSFDGRRVVASDPRKGSMMEASYGIGGITGLSSKGGKKHQCVNNRGGTTGCITQACREGDKTLPC